MSGDTLAAYYRHDTTGPDVTEDGVERWYAPATNFAVETLRAEAGSRVALRDHPDEHCLVLTEGCAALRVRAGAAEVTADEPGVVVVPPGDSEIELLTGGYVHRVVSRASPLHARARQFGRAPEPAIEVAPLVPGPPPDGYALRLHRVSDHGGPGTKQVFRSADLMISMIFPSDVPRAPERLSPHFHDGFEQGCLVSRGTYVHHVRRQWGPDSTRWRPDEHETVGAPSVTVIAPPDVHTAQNIGTGPFRHVDIFCPPRRDFIDAGLVRNAADYPQPDGLRP